MLAARLHAPGEPLRLEELALPDPTGTQVRVRVAGCGVCRTDLHIARGEMTRVELPITLGHEIAGWIDAVGPQARTPLRDAGLRAGDPVLVFGGWGCGSCLDCSTGDEQRCAIGRAPGFQGDGGYASAVLVPHPRHLLALGELEPVSAAPLADAGVTPYRAVRRAERWLVPSARALVIGAGGLGQFCLQYLRLLDGLRVAVVEPDAGRRARAIDLGADAALADLEPGQVREALGGPPNVIFDLVGTDATLAAAGSLSASDGLLMLVGEAGGHLRFGFQLALESWVTSTVWGSRSDLQAVAELASAGRITWSVERIPLAEAQRALDRLAAGEVSGRLVLVPPRDE